MLLAPEATVSGKRVLTLYRGEALDLPTVLVLLSGVIADDQEIDTHLRINRLGGITTFSVVPSGYQSIMLRTMFVNVRDTASYYCHFHPLSFRTVTIAELTTPCEPSSR